jgi:hypothetical protein
MAMKLLKEAFAGTGKYVNKDGQEKTKWLKVGVLLVDTQDPTNMSLKIEAEPAHKPEGGWWIRFFDPKPRDGNGSRAQTGARQNGDFEPDGDSDVPF